MVVLTDGGVNGGNTCLDDLIEMMSAAEDVVAFCGLEGDSPQDLAGNPIDKESIIGIRPAVTTRFPVQIFFIAIGEAVRSPRDTLLFQPKKVLI